MITITLTDVEAKEAGFLEELLLFIREINKYSFCTLKTISGNSNSPVTITLTLPLYKFNALQKKLPVESILDHGIIQNYPIVELTPELVLGIAKEMKLEAIDLGNIEQYIRKRYELHGKVCASIGYNNGKIHL